MTPRRIPLVAALAVWSLSPAAATAQTTLRYKFKQGDTFKYVMEQKMKMTRVVMGESSTMTAEQVSDLTWTVQGVDAAGNARITIKFGRNKMTMNLPTEKIEVDSAANREPDSELGRLYFKVMKKLSGLETSATVSPTGEFSDIALPEETLQELQKIPGANALGDAITADGLKRVMKQSGLILPKDPVSVGKSWTTRTDTKMPYGKLLADLECTYSGSVEKDGRTLEKLTLTPKVKIEPDAGAPIMVKLKSHQGSGAAYFDSSAGRLLEVSSQQTMEMDIDATISERIVQTSMMRLAK